MENVKSFYVLFVVSLCLVLMFFYCYPTIYKYEIDKRTPMEISWENRILDLTNQDVKFYPEIAILNCLTYVFMLCLLEFTGLIEVIPDLNKKNIILLYKYIKSKW